MAQQTAKAPAQPALQAPVRGTNLPQKMDYDLLVVGGGINGVGIARDAAGRGLRVLLCERDDLAAHTSSASTKLIHGGLRYLEYYEFSLVRKALQEREVLLRSAPHIIWPLRFVMPHMPSLRPAWLIRIGLFLYDHLSKRELLPGSRSVTMRDFPAGRALVDTIKRGFVYSDAWVNDARLVVLNAMAAAEHGAVIRTRTALTAASRTNVGNKPGWKVTLRGDGVGNTGDQVLHVRAIANAAGPWVGQLLKDVVSQAKAQHAVRLVKGSHIVTQRLFDHDHAYIFQNPDKRIIFAIPYEEDFTLIGTTDLEFKGNAGEVKIDQEEIDYLCNSVNQYFKRKITPSDVVWTYSGVRPLLEEDSDNPSAVTRDYHLDMDDANGAAPLLSVFGGKITTFRKLAEQAVDKLAASLGVSKASQTAHEALPGGDIANADFERFLDQLQQEYAWLPAALAHRYARAYGTRTRVLLANAKALSDLGEPVLPGVYETELRYLRDHEWATCAEDVLWRRSKLGLHLPADSATRLDAWLASQQHGEATIAQATAKPRAEVPVAI